MKIFLARTFLKAGDLKFNFKKITDVYNKALKEECDLVVFSEMSLTGFPIYELAKNEKFIEENNYFLEKIVKKTKNEKTKIMLGCLYFVKEFAEEDEKINRSKLYNSVVFINDGYIDEIVSKTSISKSNLFEEYKYFDREVGLKDIQYETDSYSVLIGDDIDEIKNVFYIKDKDSEIVFCLDTLINKNIENRKKQLEKIAKFSRKGIIYLNNFGYDERNNYQFDGECFVLNGNGETIYSNTEINETFIKFNLKFINGKSDILILNKKEESEEFINITAKNNKNKLILDEIKNKIKIKKNEKNIELITFNKEFSNKNIKFIDYTKYIRLKKIILNLDIKKLIINDLYGKNYIFFSN
jgi:NAD+ synthase (glutamine-hydrolysing)